VPQTNPGVRVVRVNQDKGPRVQSPLAVTIDHAGGSTPIPKACVMPGPFISQVPMVLLAE